MSKPECMYEPQNYVVTIFYRKGVMMNPKRYENLFMQIRKHDCTTLMEIGVWNGNHAMKMIKAAQVFGEVSYYGFDLFEMCTAEIVKKEFAKKPPSMDTVSKLLEATGESINLYRGQSKDTVKDFIRKCIQVDFIFIDGGHSQDTVKTDWQNVQQLMNKNTVVIFDDYFYNSKEHECFGCKNIIDNLDKEKYSKEFLMPVDIAEDGLHISMVKVMRK